MTTIDAAAAYARAHRIALAAVLSSAVFGLAGCETSSSILGTGNSNVATNTIAPTSAAQPVPQASILITIAPVIGPPEAVGKQLVSQLTEAAEKQRIVVAKSVPDASSYTLRGYFVAPAKDKSTNKLSYIWDVADPAGKHVNRITGEEVLVPAPGGDSWAAMTPKLIQVIADKTAASLAAWRATQQQPALAVAGTPPTGAAVAAASSPATAATAPVQTAAISTGATGSISGAAGGLLSMAPKVSGAPGDGNTALAAAMRRELGEKGIQFNEQGQNAYRIAGDVKIKPPKDGNQAITINWTISDPKGVYVARITQNNDVPAGYLDSTWGQSAEDAAKAAAVQVKQVIGDHHSGKPIQYSASGASKAQ